jgi:hypothetical protein
LAFEGFAYRHPTPVTDLPTDLTADALKAYGAWAYHWPPLYLAALAAYQPPLAA